MKSWLKPIIIFLSAVGFLGVVVMLSGVVNIAASGGHWPITAWILNFSMERSVSTYSLLVDKHPIDDPRMIVRGAGHYEVGCRQCHGDVNNVNVIGLSTTPKSPFLPPKMKEWEADELFRIVKHGVKFTGMPAWPALKRDDEVWDMVAFLKKLPELDQKSYNRLVYGEDGRTVNNCTNCHGVDGNGRGEGAFPKLAGQNREYLIETLEAYKNGERHSGTMELVAHGLEKEMIEELSTHYSKQVRKPTLTRSKLSPAELQESIQRGSLIARNGIPAQEVAACIGCHGPDVNGRPRKPHFPDLRGQPASYLSNQLRLILEDKRGGTHHLNLMKKAVKKLTPQQREDVSLYYESLLHVSEDSHPSDVGPKD